MLLVSFKIFLLGHYSGEIEEVFDFEFTVCVMFVAQGCVNI